MLKDTLIVIKAIVTSITNTEAKNNSAYTYVFWQASGVYGLPPLNLRLQIVRIVSVETDDNFCMKMQSLLQPCPIV